MSSTITLLTSTNRTVMDSHQSEQHSYFETLLYNYSFNVLNVYAVPFMCTVYFRDLAEERGHKKCITFLQNPEKAFLEEKRKHAITKVHNYDCLTLVR